MEPFHPFTCSVNTIRYFNQNHKLFNLKKKFHYVEFCFRFRSANLIHSRFFTQISHLMFLIVFYSIFHIVFYSQSLVLVDRFVRQNHVSQVSAAILRFYLGWNKSYWTSKQSTEKFPISGNVLKRNLNFLYDSSQSRVLTLRLLYKLCHHYFYNPTDLSPFVLLVFLNSKLF